MTLGLRGLFCGNRNWGLSVSLRGQRLKVLVVYCDDRLGVHLAGCKRQVVDLVVDCMIKEPVGQVWGDRNKGPSCPL